MPQQKNNPKLRRVAIVEDDSGLRDQLQKILKSAPGVCCAGTFSSAEKALEDDGALLVRATANGTYATTLSNGKASVTRSDFFATTGTYLITASISGDADFNDATATMSSKVGTSGRLV